MVRSGAVFREIKSLLEEADIADAALEAGLIFAHIAGDNRFDIDQVSDEKATQMREMAEQRAASKTPLQYLLGSWEFMGLLLAVGPGVLVPRPETELVAMAALEKITETPVPVALDLCAGSGAIALSLQKERPNADVIAVEWDDEAYTYLARNCEAYAQRWKQVPQLVKADALEYWQALTDASLDLIVSNPPYVTQKEYESLEPELYHEPKQALVAEEEGLLFYRVIAQKYRPKLKRGGSIVFEIGAEQGEAVASILQTAGYTRISIKNDYANLPRIAIAESL